VISGADLIFQEDQTGLVNDEIITDDGEAPALSQEHASITTDKIEVLGQEMETAAKNHELSLGRDHGTAEVNVRNGNRTRRVVMLKSRTKMT
jgi:hypothetical protein